MEKQHISEIDHDNRRFLKVVGYGAVGVLPGEFYLTMMQMRWSINGRVFQMEEVADDEVVRLGTREVREFYNTGDGMMNMKIWE